MNLNSAKEYYLDGEDKENILTGYDDYLHVYLTVNAVKEYEHLDTQVWPFNDVQKKRLGIYVGKIFYYLRHNDVLSGVDIEKLKKDFRTASDYRSWKKLKCQLHSIILSHLELNAPEGAENIHVHIQKERERISKKFAYVVSHKNFGSDRDINSAEY